MYIIFFKKKKKKEEKNEKRKDKSFRSIKLNTNQRAIPV